MKRVLGYVRVSTNTQDLKRQKDLIEEYCNVNGYDLIHIEEDYAISGAKSDRDGLNRVLAVDNSLFDMVVVSELSRISRQDDIISTLQQIHQIISKVDLVILDDKDKVYKAGEQLSLTDFLLLAIKAYGAADERKKISSRMQSGIDSKFAQNVMMGVASVPYGFKLVDNPNYERGKTSRKLYDIDTEAANIVKQMYQYVLDGYSINQITAMLNSQRIGGKKFEASNVRYILHNKFYKGIRRFKGQDYKMPDEYKLIDDNTWNLVQERMRTNRGYNYEGQKKHFNPLKGIAKCPCGANITITFGSNHKGEYSMILSCADRARRLGTGCNNSGIRGEYLFNIVWNDVYKTIWFDAKTKKDSENPYKVKSNETIKKLQTELQKFRYALPSKETAIKDKTGEIETVANNMALVTNPTVLATFNKRVEKLQGELDRLTKEKGKLERQIAKTEARIKDEQKMLTEKELANMTEEGKAEIYKRMLDRVTYYSFNGHHKGYIEIVYKNGHISRHLYLINSKHCYSWAIPYFFNVDREKKIIYSEGVTKVDKDTTILLLPSSYTLAEFQKKFEDLRVTHK